MPAPKEITPEEWLRIVKVYARHEGRLRAVSVELGWPIARTTRLWMRGYPSLGYPSIKTVIARDGFSEMEVRARRAEISAALPPSAHTAEARAEVIHGAEEHRLRQMVVREQMQERARQDAVKSRAEEAMLISINRKNAIALNAMTAQILKGATTLSQKIQQDLEKEAISGTLPVGQRLHLVRAAASIARFNAEASVMAVKAERMVLNQPIEADSDEAGEHAGTLDEAEVWLNKYTKALKRAKERGLIVVSTGGNR